MRLFDKLQERGFVDQVTDPKLADLLERPMSFYLGIDPSAASPHIGNFVGFMMLAHLARAGHNPVLLIGGATGLIGDPSGRDTERPMQTVDEIASNVASLEKVIRDVLSRLAPDAKPTFVNNLDWYGNMNVTTFLRDVGKTFRMGTMLAKESVRSRLSSDEGMSFTEFSYQILQGYDFYHLHERYNVRMQIGGSDQWGNITSGTEYSRKTSGVELHGLTFPLLTRSDGKKFGKSVDGAIWLSGHLCSPFQFYQYFLQIPDQDVIHLMQMLTFMDMEEIKQIQQEMLRSSYVPNTAQKVLASEVTKLVHGDAGLEKALLATKASGMGSGEINLDLLDQIAGDLPHITMSWKDIEGQSIIDVLHQSTLLSSKGEARKLVKNGGAYLNNAKISDEKLQLSASDVIQDNKLLLGAGKKKRLLIILSDEA